ncbi:hypothetical protein Dimus_010226 [Dionaea muscipula]
MEVIADSLPMGSLSLSCPSRLQFISPATTTTPSLAMPQSQHQKQQQQQSVTLRQWRSAAQRNLRNQWSNLAAYRQDWISSSSEGRSHATSLVNSYLSHRYMDAMDLGVLIDMPNIRDKACYKLLKKQELFRSRVLSSYKCMVATVVHMINASRSMRCFSQAVKGYSLLQFSSCSDDKNDAGDGGGIPVFTFLPVSAFEELAQELVEMFKWELILKRLLAVELLSICCVKTEQADRLSWSDELYQGETEELCICNLYMEETSKPVIPRVQSWRCDTKDIQSNNKADQQILQVYLTTWIAEVNLDSSRYEHEHGDVSKLIKFLSREKKEFRCRKSCFLPSVL